MQENRSKKAKREKFLKNPKPKISQKYETRKFQKSKILPPSLEYLENAVNIAASIQLIPHQSP